MVFPVFLLLRFLPVLSSGNFTKMRFVAEIDPLEDCATGRLMPFRLSYQYESRNPSGPVVECSLLPDAFIDCDEPMPAPSNYAQNGGSDIFNGSLKDEGKCAKMGGTRAEEIEFTYVTCRPLPCIECRGQRDFLKLVPCIRYTGHYFLSTLLYSVFLGIVAVDRFCLGYSAMAVGKLMTLGGFGIWWIVDIFLLVFGVLVPADDSNWEPNY